MFADDVDLSTTRCLGCDCPRGQWPNPDGYRDAYCCEGCADGGRCTCGAAELADGQASDERSRMDTDHG